VGSQRAARHMAANGGGVIVNTTSIGGINAGAGVMTYRATKAAVIHFTRSIAVELAALGIRVNCIAPAHIPTAINAAFDQGTIVLRDGIDDDEDRADDLRSDLSSDEHVEPPCVRGPRSTALRPAEGRAQRAAYARRRLLHVSS